MFRLSAFTVLVLFSSSIFASKSVEGSQPVIQKTTEDLFTARSQTFPGACKLVRATARQNNMCKKDGSVSSILVRAKEQAIDACEDAFRYDRWNCTLDFNRKSKKRIFNKIYRETAFVYALISASLTHTVAKGCASGEIVQCSCVGRFETNTSQKFKTTGCGDDFRYGKKFTRNFLDFKRAGSDQIAEILKQDALIGIDSIGEQLREVCKCHGFSGSCTTKTCWKRLTPFSSVMGLLKKHYHHAVRKKIVNYTSKRAITPKVKKNSVIQRKKLMYLQKTPNLCVSTKGRVCKDRDNCATLCCGRGYITSKRSLTSRCRCKMANCCFVQCDTCVDEVNYYTCK